MAEYPAAIKSFTDVTDNVDDYLATHVNVAYDEIEAVQTELGTDPAGDSHATVVARLDQIETDITSAGDTTEIGTNLTSITALENFNIGACYYMDTDAVGADTIATGHQIMDFNIMVWDTDTAVTTGAAWKFTAPVSGRYQINLVARTDTFDYAADDYLLLRVYKEGAEHRRLPRWTADATNTNTPRTMGGSCIVELAATEYLDVRLTLGNHAGIAYNAGSASYNRIEIAYCGNATS